MRLPNRAQDAPNRSADDQGETRRWEYVIAVMEAYARWRDACRAVSDAYDNWRQAPRREHDLSFCEYIAALNCEEEAARACHQAVRQYAAVTPT